MRYFFYLFAATSGWPIVSLETVGGEPSRGPRAAAFSSSLLQGKSILEQCTTVRVEKCLAGIDSKLNPTC